MILNFRSTLFVGFRVKVNMKTLTCTTRKIVLTERVYTNIPFEDKVTFWIESTVKEEPQNELKGRRDMRES